MNELEQLALQLARGSNATEDTIYLPVECLGKIMHIGMRMEREIRNRDQLIAQLKAQVETLLRE